MSASLSLNIRRLVAGTILIFVMSPNLVSAEALRLTDGTYLYDI